MSLGYCCDNQLKCEVQHYRYADSDKLAKGEIVSGIRFKERRSTPYGDTTVFGRNNENNDFDHLLEMDMSDFEWYVEDATNRGVNLLKPNVKVTNPDE